MKDPGDDGGGVVAPIVFVNQMDFDALAETVFYEHGKVLDGSKGLDLSEHISTGRKDEVLGRIRSVLMSAFGVYFGSPPADRFPDLFVQIASFAEHLAKDHIFADGNKRTTVRMALALMISEGIRLDVPDDPDPMKNQVYMWIQNVVDGTRTTEELAGFLRDHAKRMP